MKCWRDLSHECAGKDCPMWMESFDLSNFIDKESIGMNDSRCALVFNEKIGMFKKMLDLMESMSFSSDFFNEELLDLMGENKKLPASLKIPAARVIKKPASPAKKKHPVDPKQQPLR